MAETLLEEPEPEDDAGTSRRSMDGELRTMGAILRLLDEMELDARSRIVSYIQARFVKA